MRMRALSLAPQWPESASSHENDFGETALKFAPKIRLANGESAVPQQFLNVCRNQSNLSNILANISTPSNFQLFAGQEGSCLFLVVGVIGKENYPSNTRAREQTKIVYGRRWIIEESTPTSEVVQTAMLAIKKAREHEVRELVTLSINHGKNRATPFNCHLDLPLMVGNQALMQASEVPAIDDLIEGVRVDGNRLKLVRSVTLGSKRIVEVALAANEAQCYFSELEKAVITVICEDADGHDFLHQLMATLIKQSDRYVEESVAFKGFHRFSHNVDVLKLAEFSYQTRNVSVTDTRFNNEFKDMSYRVDAAKAPVFNVGELGRQQRQKLAEYDVLGGYLPCENLTASEVL